MGNENGRETSNRELKPLLFLPSPLSSFRYFYWRASEENVTSAAVMKKLEPIKINGTSACLTTPYLLWFLGLEGTKLGKRSSLSVERRRKKFHDAQLRDTLYVFVMVWIHDSFLPSFCIFLCSRNESSRLNDSNNDLGFQRSKSS